MHLQTHFVNHCRKILFTLIILILDIEIFYLIQENWSGQWWSLNELDILSKCNDKSWNSCSDIKVLTKVVDQILVHFAFYYH